MPDNPSRAQHALRDMLRLGMLARGSENESSARGYRRLLELGRGGMARVHLAERVAHGVRKLVVLKVLNPELAVDPELRAAFRREAELSARLNHPNVVQVLEVFESSLAPVIVMEHLDGVSLGTVLKHYRGELPLSLHLHVLCHVLSGLHYLHELCDLDGSSLNAVHRDVSPQNVMVLYDGAVKVLDFGIAKVNTPEEHMTQTGVVKGKLHYMPPEQLLGERSLDRRADLFAVGVMLWEAVKGRRMWTGNTDQDVVRCLATAELPALGELEPDVPAALRRIVERATHPQREERFQTALEMQIELEAVLAERGWYVQPRALADFLQARFAERRARQQAQLKATLLNPGEGELIADAAGDSAVHVIHADGPPPASSFRTTRRALIPPAQRRWVYLALAGVVLAVVGMALPGLPGGEATPVAEAARMLLLEVEVTPSNAEILLDGAIIGRGRFRGAERATENKRVLEVRAAGYVPERRELVLQQNSSLQFVLKPVPAPVESESPPATVSAGGAPAKRVGSRDRTPDSAGPRRTHKRSSHCNPPYVLGADGVKTFKPECY